MHVDRRSFADYSNSLKALTNEELCQEIWVLDEHIKYLIQHDENPELYIEFIVMAKEEKELRMFAQGYQ